eukprot:gene4526-4964_t
MFNSIYSDPSTSFHRGKDVARCQNCGGYINAFCDTNTSRWLCSICGKRNTIHKQQIRYRQGDYKMLPEMKDNFTEYKLAFDAEDKIFAKSARERPLIHLFLINEEMHIESLQATIDALSAGVKNMHPDIHVIIMTFSGRMGVFSLGKNSSVAAVQYSYFGNVDSSQVKSEGSHASLQVPLESVTNFWDCPVPIGDCRDSMEEALQAIFDMSANRQEHEDISNSTNISLGSVLLSLYEWIVDSSQSMNNCNLKQKSKGSFDFSKLWHIFNNEAGLSSPFDPSTITDRYSGLILHIFTDQPQSAPSHTVLDDVMLYADDSVHSLSDKFAELSISIQFWGLCSFDSNELGLLHILPLIQKTGGQLHRIVLGVQRDLSQAIYVEEMTRSLCSRYATKCLVKVRTSSALDCNHGVTGAYWKDPRAVGLYQVAAMTADSALGYQLAFHNEVHGSLADDGLQSYYNRERMLIVQLAFSFETLVEDVLIEQEEEHDDKNDVDGKSSHHGMENGEDTLMGGSVVIPPSHLQYLETSLKHLGLHQINETLIKEVLQEPLGGNVTQKSMRRRTQLHRAKGSLPYSTKKRLQVVKVLRIVTVGLDCTSRLSAFLQSSDNASITAIILREVIQEQLLRMTKENQGQASSSSPLVIQKEKEELSTLVTLLNQPSCSCGREFMNWATRLLLSQYRLKANSSSVNNENGSGKPNRSIDLTRALEGQDGPGVKRALLQEGLSFTSSTGEVIFLLCSALIKVASSLSPERAALSNRIEDGGNGMIMPDKAVLFLYESITFTPPVVEQSLHPSFQAINEDCTIMNGLLALARDSMIRSGAKTFLLDGGRELLLYKHADRFVRKEDGGGVEGEGGMDNNNSFSSAKQDGNDKDSKVVYSDRIMDGSSFVQMAEYRNSVINGLAGSIIRRLSQFPIVTTAVKAEAGTATASYIAPYLLLDNEANIVSYSTLIDFLIEVATSLI